MRPCPGNFTRSPPFALLGAASVLFGLLLSCGRVRTAPDEVVVLIENPVRTLDPRFTSGSYDLKLSRLVAPGLTTVDTPDSRPALLLAESIVREAPGRYLVTVRPDAYFPDGTPATAEDVAYTFASTVDPELRSSSRAGLSDKGFSAAAIEVLGPRTLRFSLPRPLATFWTDLELGILEKKLALGGGDGGRFRNGEAVGAGPFRVVSRSDDRVELVPNPHWLGGAPTLRHVVFRVIRDDGSRLLALVGGSADLVQNSAAPAPLLLRTVLANPRVKAQTGRSATWSYMGLNCEDPLLRDVRIRRAIAMGIDREAIIAAKYRGYAVLSGATMPPTSWSYAPEVGMYRYDPAFARTLLAQAGAEGAHLVLKTSTASKFRQAIARVIARQLGEIGLDIEIQAYEFGTFFGDIKRGNFQMFMLQQPEVTDPDTYYSFFHSSRVPTRDDLDAGSNRFRYRDPELDRWLIQGKETEELSERKRIYGRVQRRLFEQVPAVPLWHDDNIAVLRKEVEGYEIYPDARFSSLARVRKTP